MAKDKQADAIPKLTKTEKQRDKALNMLNRLRKFSAEFSVPAQQDLADLADGVVSDMRHILNVLQTDIAAEAEE